MATAAENRRRRRRARRDRKAARRETQQNRDEVTDESGLKNLAELAGLGPNPLFKPSQGQAANPTQLTAKQIEAARKARLREGFEGSDVRRGFFSTEAFLTGAGGEAGFSRSRLDLIQRAAGFGIGGVQIRRLVREGPSTSSGDVDQPNIDVKELLQRLRKRRTQSIRGARGALTSRAARARSRAFV